MTVQTERIKIGEICVAQSIIGEGTPILMLHGWGANISLMMPLSQRLAPQGYKIYMLDLPGFGESDPPPAVWTVFDYAQFVIQFSDYHHLERFYLFGHSFGGRLGLILGADYSERIFKMVLADSAGIPSKSSFSTQLRLTIYKGIRDGLKRMSLDGVSDALRERYNQRYGSTDFQNASGVMRETFVNVVNQDLKGYAARVKPSTLLLWGDRDEDTPLWQGKLLEKTIPDAGLVVYEGAGHYSYLDRLADAAKVVDYFFKQSK